jgi:protein Tex
MLDVTALDFSRIAQDLQIRKTQVESVVQLLDEGNTIPFITRYRKERTGGLHEEVLRQIQVRVTFQRQLADRKQTILKSIEGQGKLTASLREQILAADTTKRLEDLYLPYKPKKRTLATAAREKGLEPLALAIWNRDSAISNLTDSWTAFLNPEKELATVEDVQAGVRHILAEMIAERAEVRAVTRSLLWETGKIAASKNEKLAEGQGLDYKDYFEFSEPLRQIPPHRILALNRGEKENALKIRLEFNAEVARKASAHALAEGLLAAAPVPVVDGAAPQTPAQGEPLAPDSGYRTAHASVILAALEDALTRLVFPSLEREVRRELSDEAEAHAVMVFVRNLRSLLLQPPLRNRRVLAIDPGFRTGCKAVALDEHGYFLEETVLYPHPPRERKHKETPPPAAATPVPAPNVTAAAATPEPAPPVEATATPQEAPPADQAASVAEAAPTAPPIAAAARDAAPPAEATPPAPSPPAPAPGPSKRDEAKAKVVDLVARHHLNVIAIGNGTACRETEEFISEIIQKDLPDLAYVIVNEAGASVYSASAIGREEFPDHDATVRGTISIGRRLQDPLSELVKVDPQNIGVGLYQHDVSPRHLKDSLEHVIESCVNAVGVDLNTASVPLLRHVSGLNQMVARDVVEYRKHHGAFKNREQLLQVPNIGPGRFVQAAGFLKISDGDNCLDRTWIHPESYGITARLLSDLGYGPDALGDKSRTDELKQRLATLNVEETAQRLQAGGPTLRDIIDSLTRPGRDPREDLPPPVFKKGILRIEDLTPNMELKGTVLNVVDFGAFVDIGLKDSGLVHISQMANRYIKSPYDVVAVSDVVTVWVLKVDQERHRVSLTMIAPGTERKPPEKKPFHPRARSQAPAGAAQGSDRPQQSGPPRQGGARSQDQRGQHQGSRPGGPPPRRGGGPRPQGAPAHAAPQGAPSAGAHQESAGQNRPAAPPPPPPRRPRREPPKPKLSQAALEGKAPLRTFAELGALFAAKQTPPPAPTPPAPAPDPEPVAVAVDPPSAVPPTEPTPPVEPTAVEANAGEPAPAQ